MGISKQTQSFGMEAPTLPILAEIYIYDIIYI
jgi:hypothetical protein